ncbi:MAG: hypothetical protein L3K04_02475 [Thermoplasmata archaeon]|nr:hypothetical protein [Thermoplasmata archaeon]MCI4341516.1 hypothetical protein [Thermoplasmata archaeon]
MPASEPQGAPRNRPGPDKIRLALAALLLLDFVVAVVMLVTDKNLQTNFGAQKAYYSHWYGVLAMALVDVVGATVVLVFSFPSSADGTPGLLRRHVGLVALAWSLLAVLAMVGIVESYSQVGFPSMTEFEKYLFGTSAYPGALSYIPWLYDFLLACYLLTAVVAVIVVWRSRSKAAG